MVEIAGYGKIQPVTKQQLIYRSVGDTTSFGLRYRERLMQETQKNHFTPLVKAGYMEKYGIDWVIRPAQTINDTTYARIWREDIPRNLPFWHNCKNARKLWVEVGPYEYKKVRHVKIKYADIREYSEKEKPGMVEAVYTWSGRMNKKKFDMVVFPVDESAKVIPVPQEMAITYQEQISQEQAKLLGPNSVLRNKQPVFYLEENNKLIFFSHTKMLRLPYLKSPWDFVPSYLKPTDKIDLAEAIFGYINLNVEVRPSMAGRVFFSDATLAPDQTDVFVATEAIIPKILGDPKATSFQHYLVQETPDPKVVGKTRDGKPRTQVFLSHYASPSPDDPEEEQKTAIRGHKFYWHNKVGLDDIKAKAETASERQALEKSTQHTRIQPVKSGVIFTFKIRFENLSEVELGALLWVLDLPEGHRHKLGMGKPLGMGSVKIKTDLCLDDRQKRYEKLFSSNNTNWFCSANPVKETESFKLAFESFVLSQLEKSDETLGDQERIKTLLSMLSWDNRPASNKIEYMEDLKKFRYRPVLPTPQGVVGEQPSVIRDKSDAPRETTQPTLAYPIRSEVKAKIAGAWKKGRLPVDLENGEKGFLRESRKTIARIQGDTFTGIVVDYKNGIYFLKLP